MKTFSKNYLRTSTYCFIIVLALLQSCMQVFTQDAKVPSSEVVESNNETLGINTFAFKLYKSLASKEENFFVSPFSLHTLLALAFTGAKEETAKELEILLSTPLNMEAKYKTILDTLKDPVLKIANKIFVDSSASLNESFQVNAQRYFSTIVESLNLTGDAEGSRKHINDWVKDNTNNMIIDLLQPGAIDASTKMFLVDAVHFIADWSIIFPVTSTVEKPFHVSNSIEVPVKMMHIKETKCLYDFNEELRSRVVELKYAGDRFSMLVIVPYKIDGLSALEDLLETTNVEDIKSKLYWADVEINLPKFKMENTVNLKETLISLGVPTMFGKNANFSGMTNEDVRVGNVVQKAYVEVNEKGTEAAAATSVVLAPMSATRTKKIMADHPFIFIITHNSLPVFIGRYVQP